MPTGYTKNISSGISFEEFVLNCARAFIYEMREVPEDTPIPENFEISFYHKVELEREEKSLKYWMGISDDEADRKTKRDYKEKIKRNKETIKEKTDLRKKYEKMLESVKNWIPPENHNELKKFMTQQIYDSIEIDCDTKYYHKESILQSGEEYKEARIEMIKKDIEYHKRNYEKEVERVNETDKWVKQLRESL